MDNLSVEWRRTKTRPRFLLVFGVLALFAVVAFSQNRTPRAPLPDVGVLGSTQVEGCGADAVVISAPASNLPAVVQAHPEGTCFVLSAGTYRFGNVVPKNNMSFIGVSTDTVVLDGNGFENAFHGTADRVTIAHMTFAGFNNSGGTKRQEQAPIRGTRALWGSFRGTMATNWRIDSIVSRDNYASGLWLGDHFVVTNSEFTGNGTTGIGANEILGGVLENNEVHHNGASQLGGAYVNGGGIKVTQVGTPEEPLIVRNNKIHNNIDIGLWCDISCQGFIAVDNYIHDHRSSAIVIELSSGAVIEGNRIERSSTWSDFGIDWNAGSITIAESADSIVRNNYIADGRGGVIVRQTLRPSRPAEDFLDRFNQEWLTTRVDNVLVEGNYMKNVELVGYGTGVTGRGIVANPASIRFVDNHYADPSSIQFSHGEQRYSYAGWTASGRDVAQSGAFPSAGEFGIDAGTPAAARVSTGATSQPTITTAPAAAASGPVALPIRINAGGPALTVSGIDWVGDQFFVGGQAASHGSADVAATELDDVYQSERWGASGYKVPIANGTYTVRLHHAELYSGCQEASCRVFDVTVEGATVHQNLDIYAAVGGRTAMTSEVTVDVTDGVLDIDFTRDRQEPQIVGIEVLIPGTSAPNEGGLGNPTPPTGVQQGDNRQGSIDPSDPAGKSLDAPTTTTGSASTTEDLGDLGATGSSSTNVQAPLLEGNQSGATQTTLGTAQREQKPSSQSATSDLPGPSIAPTENSEQLTDSALVAAEEVQNAAEQDESAAQFAPSSRGASSSGAIVVILLALVCIGLFGSARLRMHRSG